MCPSSNMALPSVSSLSVKKSCCMALVYTLGPKVVFPGSTRYNDSLASYFSAQEMAVHPQCIVMPETADDVSTAVKTITSRGYNSNNSKSPLCQFAIRSGGHTNFAGAANIADGVTIDLRGLNAIRLSDDMSTVSVGPGATWDLVYSALDPLHLSVAGGRASGVGVGGLSTGGGISFFSPRYGWTFDTIVNYDVVLANGSMVSANDHENRDLLVALRGGSNNFGIVTNVVLSTFQQGLMWGGVVYKPASTVNTQIEELVRINSVDSYDEYASLNTAFGFSAVTGVGIANQFVYTKPVENPPIYHTLLELPSLAPGTMRIANMTDMALETGALQQHGARQIYMVTTLLSTIPVLNATWTCFNEIVPVIQGIDGIVWSLVLEPLPPAIYARHSKLNSLGLVNRTEPLIVVLLTASWSNVTDDEVVNRAAEKLLTDVESAAQKLEGWDPYKYLNYAGDSQDPIRSYGRQSLTHLKYVRSQVDPKGIFTYQVPGGFKIPS
ncbi:putative oxidoreductase [Nemania sp. FL0031]|nr:putative oxidoreductase [Nemania sp. FL0031]